MADPHHLSLRAAWRADLTAATARPSCSLGRVLWLLATRPGVLAVALLRVQQWMGRGRRRSRFAPLVRSLAHVLTGADFVPGCEIGPGLRMEHPNGVVIGAGAVVGRNAFLCQRITLGERLGRGRTPAYPTLGDDVFVGAGATVLGDVHIGSGAWIGAGTVVLHDVPEAATVVGNPGRVISGSHDQDPAHQESA
ncbi:serine O-acetyltransferase [Lentzea atacamensis]|uniref:Serine acetyltransferase n=1 Tax=Lentzea atacamensis TaxID=531938 RepID=A0A316I7Z1_9PSEU|nr:DapH/DapD/GlmU-related protein [Lentzea atacamensis]PWK89572.1 serine O-acetyltransferase [Lentzea atacamensis]RAS60648.1 serine O-acetyltransferase [Lentzea atacamensis]